MNNLKFNTHSSTPKRKSGKVSVVLLVLSASLIYSIFGLATFSCFYYTNHILTGIVLIILPLFMTIIMLSMVKDIEKAYVEINGSTIHAVDYYSGIKKEKIFFDFGHHI